MSNSLPTHPRDTRLHMAIPVFVYGTTESGAPFKEITTTVVISCTGGLIELETPVTKDQKLLLANMKTGAEITCTVASLQHSDHGKPQIGIHFDQPSPQFWGVRFPPEDWNPADRKLPDPHRR
jgi:hypothetical protein